MNRASKKTLGMPVYSVREGQNLGTVKTIVIDPAEKAVIALVIERRRMTREERVIPFTHIQSIGDDVIVVDKATSAERKANLPHIIRQMRTPLHLLGARVFTIGGKTLGKIEEFQFDTQSGKIVTLEIGGTSGAIFKEKVNIDGKYIITMATGTVMLDDQALTNQEVIENSLLNSVETAKEKASTLINETINASKRISKNISNSWDRLNNNESDGYISFDEEKKAASSEEPVSAIPVSEIIAEESPIIADNIVTEKENPPIDETTPPPEEEVSTAETDTNTPDSQTELPEAQADMANEISPDNQEEDINK